jgi:hypothetical protein
VPWADEILAQRSDDIARAVLTLIVDGPRWRHRRVETLTPLSATTVRRRVSLDLTVPPELHDGLRLPQGAEGLGPDDQWVVPLGWLGRRPLVNFDLRDGADEAVPLLLAAQTAAITKDLLLLAALEAGLRPDDAAHAGQTLDVVFAASAAAPPGEPDAIVEHARALELGSDFTELIRLSVHGFLLLAVVSHIAGRRIWKFETDELRRPAPSGLRPVYIDAQVPGINEAASTHVELELPETLEAASFHLVDRRLVPDPRLDGRLRAARVRLPEGERQPSTSPERPRLLLQPLAQARDPYVQADVLITPGDFLVPALALVLLAGVILATGLATGIEHLQPGERATAPSVLLGAFSVGYGLVLRSEANPLVRAMLVRARAALGATAAALAIAALPLALRLSSVLVLIAWIGAGAVTLGAAAVVARTFMSLTRIGRRP